jgi:hypothetical protein
MTKGVTTLVIGRWFNKWLLTNGTFQISGMDISISIVINHWIEVTSLESLANDTATVGGAPRSRPFLLLVVISVKDQRPTMNNHLTHDANG